MNRGRPGAKMDSARAIGLMGFSSIRFMDQSAGNDPKTALDKALFVQMQLLAQRKRDAAKERKEQEKREKRERRRRGSKKSRDLREPREDPYQQRRSIPNSKGPSYANPITGTSEKSKEQKYAEDVLALHEAYQFLMKKYVISIQAKLKMTHAMGTINKANMFFGALANKDEKDEISPKVPPPDEECIPCGACEAIKALKLDVESSEESEDEIENEGDLGY